MGLMDGKRGIILGVANSRSYAWYIAKSLIEAGAECAFTHLPGEKMYRRVSKSLDELGLEDPWLHALDVTDDAQIEHVFEHMRETFGTIDFVVHSIAYADRRYLQVGRFHTTPRPVWNQALDISAYSLLAISRTAARVMPRGGAIISLSYYGGEKVVPGYNVMGVAKAALEHTTRYLAMELGTRGIRVNCISGGPIRTLSSMAVPGIDLIREHHEAEAPLRRTIEGDDVGNAATFLLSDLSKAITGELLHVDAGVHILPSAPSRHEFRKAGLAPDDMDD